MECLANRKPESSKNKKPLDVYWSVSLFLPIASKRIALLLMILALAGCRSNQAKSGEVAYVTVAQASLRDRVAAVYNKAGTVSNGERVDVLERTKNGRFVRVRDPRNEEGWMEQRYLASQDVFNGFQKIARENASVPAQAVAATRAELNMHLQPARDADHLYQLKEGEKVELLRRDTSVRAPKSAAPSPAQPDSTAAPAYDDWFLVRDRQKRYGWVLSRMVDIDLPLEVAQYAEGQRIVADFVLNTVRDGGKDVPQYLLLLNEPRDGAPQDFDQLRVFTWNLRRHRYETAYRERNLHGVLPARAGAENFGGKEGTLPIFVVQVRDAGDKLSERKYKMNGVIVKRVVAAESPLANKPEAKREKRTANSQKR